jgi:hypothetical protein
MGKRGEKKMRPQKKMNVKGQQVFRMIFPCLDLPKKSGPRGAQCIEMTRSATRHLILKVDSIDCIVRQAGYDQAVLFPGEVSFVAMVCRYVKTP